MRYKKLDKRLEDNSCVVDECIVWTGGVSYYGYGRTKHNYTEFYVHRYAWEREHGEIPEGMHIDHKCHNKLCFNEEHLRLATPQQNTYNKPGANKNNNSSGVRNVHWNRDHWQVRISKEGKKHSFGSFTNLEEAAKVAEQARQELFGSFAGKG